MDGVLSDVPRYMSNGIKFGKKKDNIVRNVYFAFLKNDDGKAIGMLAMSFHDGYLEIEAIQSSGSVGGTLMTLAEVFARAYGIDVIQLRALLTIQNADIPKFEEAAKVTEGERKKRKTMGIKTAEKLILEADNAITAAIDAEIMCNLESWWNMISDGKTLPQFYAKLGYTAVEPTFNNDGDKNGFLAREQSENGLLMYKSLLVQIK